MCLAPGLGGENGRAVGGSGATFVTTEGETREIEREIQRARADSQRLACITRERSDNNRKRIGDESIIRAVAGSSPDPFSFADVPAVGN